MSKSYIYHVVELGDIVIVLNIFVKKLDVRPIIILMIHFCSSYFLTTFIGSRGGGSGGMMDDFPHTDRNYNQAT